MGKKSAKLHLDGYNFLPYLTGEQPQGPRREFHYLNDEGMPVGVRVGDWKIVYAENRTQTMALGLATTAQFLQTFEQYPPSQTPDSWSVDKLTEHYLSKAK